jgi:hypothetical protein
MYHPTVVSPFYEMCTFQIQPLKYIQLFYIHNIQKIVKKYISLISFSSPSFLQKF